MSTPQSLIKMLEGHALSCGKEPILLPAMHKEALELCAAGLKAAMARAVLEETSEYADIWDARKAICDKAEAEFKTLIDRNQNNNARQE